MFFWFKSIFWFLSISARFSIPFWIWFLIYYEFWMANSETLYLLSDTSLALFPFSSNLSTKCLLYADCPLLTLDIFSPWSKNLNICDSFLAFMYSILLESSYILDLSSYANFYFNYEIFKFLVSLISFNLFLSKISVSFFFSVL